jgi:glycosyltransferase involved in cell wall biosynthesis
MPKSLSIIIPVFNEEPNLIKLYSAIKTVLDNNSIKDYELIFVDDGSTDNTIEVLKSLKKKDLRIKLIVFQRNFGKSAALDAAFSLAEKEIIITMDGDLQDDPVEIPRFIAKIEEGFDLISGWKRQRKDPLSKTIPSKFFNWLAAILTKVKIHDFNCGFKAYKKNVVKNIEIYGELHRYIPALVNTKGFKIAEIEVKHHKREFGKSKFGTGRLFKGLFDLITVYFLTKFARRPLHFFGTFGAISFFFGTGIGIYLTIIKLNGATIGNRPILSLAVLLMVIGIQFISLGLIGELVSKNNLEKGYIIKEIL